MGKLSVREATMRKNALTTLTNSGMGMTKEQFKKKYGMTPNQAVKQTGG